MGGFWASIGVDWGETAMIFLSGRNMYHVNVRCESVLPNNEDVASRLARLARQAAERQAARASRPRRGRGRPTQLAIRKNYRRVELYVEPETLVALDELAADMEERTGAAVCRGDLIRTAVEQYLRQTLRRAEQGESRTI